MVNEDALNIELFNKRSKQRLIAWTLLYRERKTQHQGIFELRPIDPRLMAGSIRYDNRQHARFANKAHRLNSPALSAAGLKPMHTDNDSFLSPEPNGSGSNLQIGMVSSLLLINLR